jgi:hypothetical protein
MQRAKALFASIAYPVWMHCKAGADRAGIYATFFQHFHQQIPIEHTDQLRLWPYGHFRRSKSGRIDHFLKHYLAYRRTQPGIGLLEWAERIADRERIEREFRPFALASLVNDRLLRRG